VLGRLLIVGAMLVASAPVLAQSARAECDDRCQKNYQACSNGRKMPEANCRIVEERCRKACLKEAENAPEPPGATPMTPAPMTPRPLPASTPAR
jgi:hypothetical protein